MANTLLVRDYYGLEITPGRRVAFNYSGQVRLGHVTRLESSNRYGRPGVTIHVESAESNDHKITDPLNLVVIEDRPRD